MWLQVNDDNWSSLIEHFSYKISKKVLSMHNACQAWD